MGPIMFIFTILGAITTYRFWGDHTFLTVISIIITVYQLSSLSSTVGLRYGYKDKEIKIMNYYTSIGILVLFILSFLV